MPKHDIFLKKGEEIPSQIAPFIRSVFSEKSLEKLEKFGGRIQISLTAPFKVNETKIEVTETFINELISKPEYSKEKMKSLTSKQLKEVAKKLGLSIASKSNVNQTRNLIVQFLQTPEQWKGIAGRAIQDE